MEILHFWIDIEDGSGNKLGAGPLISEFFTIEKPLDKSGQCNFNVSPADPNISVLAKKLVAVCRYIDVDGTEQEFGACIIEKTSIDVNDAGEVRILVSGPDITRELNYRTVRQLEIGDATGGDTDGPDQIIALAPAGWSVTSGTTLQAVYVGFDGQSVLSALIALGEGIGEHWRLGTGREVVWLQSINQFTASGVRAMKTVPDGNAVLNTPVVALIKSLKEVEETIGVVTRVYPRGAGNGSAILRFESLVASAPAGFTVNISEGYIEDDAAVIAFDVIEREVDFKDISPLSNSVVDKEEAANMLMITAVEYLRRFSSAQRFYNIELGKVDQVLEPGTTLRVVYSNIINGVTILDIDEDLNILSVTDRIDNGGLNTVSVKVSTIDRAPITDADITVGQLEAGRVISTHAQLNANARNIDRVGTMDNANPLSVAFWFGSEVASIKNVVLRFKIDPLRSTVKSVAGASTTTPSGGGSTSGSGGATVPTSANESNAHAHGLSINNVAIVSNLGLDAFGGLTSPGGGITNTDIQNNVTTHTHTVTIPNHTHTTPNHTHTFTPNISTVYGIFEESAGNTLAQTDLVIKINGTTFTGSISSIAGGWFEADITDELIDSAFNPTQENNLIEYSTAVAKTAQITTSLSIVDIVQAVSVL